MGFAANLHRITRRLRGADVTRAHVEALLLQSDADSALSARPLDNTRLASFARRLNSLDELGPSARAALVEHLDGGETIRRIVVAPRQRLLGAGPGWRRWLTIFLPWELTPDWVLVLTDNCLLAASFVRAGAPPVVMSTPIAAIVSLELGTVLLRSWLEWTCPGRPVPAASRPAPAYRPGQAGASQGGQAQGGGLDRTRIHFSTVSYWLFRHFLGDVCLSLARQSGFEPAPDDRHLEYLSGLPFKFMNILRHDLLLPGEQVQAAIYRPAIFEQRGLFRHQRTASAALLLTNYHLLIAEEDLSESRNGYGLINRFYPRRRIRGAAVERAENDLWLNLALETHGAGQEAVRTLFEPSAGPALEEMLTLF
jgi:hypothetical protein